MKTICVGVNIIEDFYKIMKDNGMQITAVVNIALGEYLTKLGLYRKK